MQKLLFNPKTIIPSFDRYLETFNLVFEATAIGGAALSILGIINRSTRDLDLIDQEIPVSIKKAAIEFSKIHALSPDWLNSGPASLGKDLPPAWQGRVQILYLGRALKLMTLARSDLLIAKLWAMCDRMRDFEDLIALQPSIEELNIAGIWVKKLDGNPNWPVHVDLNIRILTEKLQFDQD